MRDGFLPNETRRLSLWLNFGLVFRTWADLDTKVRPGAALACKQTPFATIPLGQAWSFRPDLLDIAFEQIKLAASTPA
ncbi:hypothetical protein THIARS_80265 [Thiomonas delicata]|uniref:Uncharacterized protein n=1 Tax=Thiomonas delicata TaxID=364030 RepID=A0A238D947_THIDL|nr:hypothetical protein THIARS_80265 [Thiomonas delicata]